MPELPEVETTCRGIENYIVNKKIKNIIIRQPKLRWEIPSNISDKIINKKILSVQRRGKYILIQNSSGYLIIHLGMSGKLCLSKLEEKPTKHAHVDFIFQDIILRYDDPRRFGCILWSSDYTEHKLIQNLGIEPLTKEFNANYLLQHAANKSKNIKQLIMDGKIVVGVGNIYANEALFNAKILPTRKSSSIRKEEASFLVKEIKKVLKSAIKKGGTTLKDFASGEGKPGYFSQKLKVYGRENQPCIHCKQELAQIRINNRTTVFCNSCQK